MVSLQDLAGTRTLRDTHPIDFWALMIGLQSASIFLLILVAMIFKARRHVPADRSLAIVFGLFAIVAELGFYRVWRTRLYIPYVTPIIWGSIVIAIVCSLYYMRAEIRAFGPARRAERRRAEIAARLRGKSS